MIQAPCASPIEPRLFLGSTLAPDDPLSPAVNLFPGHPERLSNSGRPPTLLIVDDNPVVLLAQAEMFRAAGFVVHEARTGLEGLTLARQHAPDLTLLDVQLPDVHGHELCRQFKSDAYLGTLFVVLLSSSETSSGRQAAGLEAGADGYIARPIENRELLARVQSLLRIQQAESALRRAHDELERRVRERTVELEQANIKLRALSLRLVEVQESERRFLARELHDELGQLLTALKMVLDQSVPLAPPALGPGLAQAVELTRELVARLRHLSLTLRPPLLDDLGLQVAMEWQIRRFSEQTGLAIEFRHALMDRLPAPVETAFFRIAQEALTNVVRHADARTATVRLWADQERAGLQIEDNGRGFDPEAARARASTGLSGMQERVELLDGEFSLESNPGKGTRLTVELPFANPSTKDLKGKSS